MSQYIWVRGFALFFLVIPDFLEGSVGLAWIGLALYLLICSATDEIVKAIKANKQ